MHVEAGAGSSSASRIWCWWELTRVKAAFLYQLALVEAGAVTNVAVISWPHCKKRLAISRLGRGMSLKKFYGVQPSIATGRDKHITLWWGVAGKVAGCADRRWVKL